MRAGLRWVRAGWDGLATGLAMCLVLVLCLLLSAPLRSRADTPYFARYGLTPGATQTDLGTQPLGVPAGVLGAVIGRDRILQAALARLGQPLRSHPFQRGADMVDLLADQRLKAGLMGDMPTIMSAAMGHSVIVGLVKQSSTALVARGDWQQHALAGKRIGYVPASSAHHTLLQGLAAAGIAEQDVTLIPLRIDDMPRALAEGEIDAFAGWEPAPTIALAASKQNRIVFRGLSTDYFVLNKAFVARKPEAARLLVAAYLRAILWLRQSSAHLAQACAWNLADSQSFSQAPPLAGPAQLAQVTRRDLLEVPGAPALMRQADRPPLEQEFRFLSRLGKLPPGASLAQLSEAFAYDGLRQVLKEPRRYRLNQFDYTP